MSRLVLIDTDMLADDALAILFAAASPELEIGAVTCVAGRDSVEVVAHNTLRVLQLAGATGVPVASGASKPLMYRAGTGKILGQKSPWNRLSGAVEELMPAAARGVEKRHGVDLMLSLVDRNAGDVDLVTLGPLTNIALCLAMDDHFAEKVSRVVMMAGAVFVPGNSAPVAETNVYADPEAARIVFQSGLPITLVGLDVTTKVLMRSPQARSIRTSRNTGVGEFISLRRDHQQLARSATCDKEMGRISHARSPGHRRSDRSFVRLHPENVCGCGGPGRADGRGHRG